MPDISTMRRFLLIGTSVFALSIGLAACDQGTTTNGQGAQSESTAQTETAQTEAAQTESERLQSFFQAAFEENIARSPMSQSYLGIKTDYDKWDDLSAEHALEDHQINQRLLSELKAFDFNALDAKSQLSYRLFQAQAERDIEGYKWRNHSYPINQMFGWQQRIPSFLINIHRVADLSDAEAYVARLNGVDGVIDDVIAKMKAGEDSGVLPPRFVYPIVIESARNIISGAPFDDSDDDSALFEDFKKKNQRP
jgi:uncharacterized protein (DUF885 family)